MLLSPVWQVVGEVPKNNVPTYSVTKVEKAKDDDVRILTELELVEELGEDVVASAMNESAMNE